MVLWCQGVTDAIRQMEYLISERVYGGHMFILDGTLGTTVNHYHLHYYQYGPAASLWPSDGGRVHGVDAEFISCLFYDTEILTSVYDRWIFGGDFLVGPRQAGRALVGSGW